MNNTNSSQRGVLTDIGEQKINSHIAAGTKLSITHFVFGDGNGQAVSPNKAGLSLTNEVGRESITETTPNVLSGGIFMSSDMAGKYNGQWIREVGLVDLEGDLIVWCSYSPTIIDLLTSRKMIINIPILSSDTVSITIDTTKKFVSQDELNALRNELLGLMLTQDFSHYAAQLADFENDIYATLPVSIMAMIPAGLMQGICDETDYPLFTPRDGINYVLSIQTYYNDVGFEQTITIIEQSDNKLDVNLTFKRSGRDFSDAVQWDSMLGLPPNKDLIVNTLRFRTDVYAIDM
ncbi:phage tail protein [Moritella sp. F3]|uniref:phage tail-collar fiber domain-containing protein n=1 Tax=Moritella sp. F3 TaxID=2718882 RepID=UPI0018E0E7DC|nr:phage tail protein [Moritella sp. F3]GIC79489.1 hypothetical protein FMO001_42160 [Moritella sp. F1]GIC79767.1 hypothetical protein FMO003_00480 [Moritella sp. F3]